MATADDDRTVHAYGPDGAQVVRYDRASKWWLETPDGKRSSLALLSAATQASQSGWTPAYGRPGGSRFDTETRRLTRNRIAFERMMAAGLSPATTIEP